MDVYLCVFCNVIYCEAHQSHNCINKNKYIKTYFPKCAVEKCNRKVYDETHCIMCNNFFCLVHRHHKNHINLKIINDNDNYVIYTPKINNDNQSEAFNQNDYYGVKYSDTNDKKSFMEYLHILCCNIL